MIIELHMIQNVVPANLNRDDTGSPKDCTFGGVRRSRVSSQSLKRAARLAFPGFGLDTNETGVRTRRVLAEVAQLLAGRGRNETEATTVVTNALANIGLSLKEKGNSEYLLFLGSDALDRFAGRCEAHWDALLSEKKMPKGAVKELQASDLLDARKAVDVALFGRMIADLPDHNIHAACQVAHAISTHEVRGEFDYFTAVDDLLPDSETGAGMIDTVEFNSACLYRYSNVDTDQLVENLGGDRELAERGLKAYLGATVTSLPSGKQNSMAAHNPPSLVFAVKREHGQWNLANAFADPVRPSPQRPLVDTSVKQLLDYYADLTRAFPHQRPSDAGCLTVGVSDVGLPEGVRAIESLDELVAQFGEL